jgi:hypothetical protein
MKIYQDRQPEPFAIQLVGKRWQSAYVRIDVEEEHIELSLSQERRLDTFVGVLSGESPRFKLVFHHSGWVRSYFKVFDPDTDVCIGTARCLKETGTKIVEVLMRNKSHFPKPQGQGARPIMKKPAD